MKPFILIINLLTLTLLCYSQPYEGSIIRVIDGDTYVFQTEYGSFVVRMQGIDAPERNQPYSQESAGFLCKYLNKTAKTLKTGTDRYGRAIGTLFVNGVDINLLSIKEGNSWHFIKYSSDQHYASAEESARKNKIGLWQYDNSIAPWEWRKK
jgi:micrococcal nuclease